MEMVVCVEVSVFIDSRRSIGIWGVADIVRARKFIFGTVLGSPVSVGCRFDFFPPNSRPNWDPLKWPEFIRGKGGDSESLSWVRVVFVSTPKAGTLSIVDCLAVICSESKPTVI